MVHGLKMLGFRKDDSVLIPSYICSVVPQAINDVCKFAYYPVNSDFSPDWSELSVLVSNETKAIMMVHYFGQPQDIERFIKFSAENDLLLIEDNSHGHSGHVGGRMLGAYGDMGFSSPRKILRTNSGGSLYLNGVSVPVSRSVQPIKSNLFKYALRYFVNNLPVLKNNLRKSFLKLPDYTDPYYFKESCVEEYRADPYSEKIIKLTDWVKVASARRKRWCKWGEFALRNGLKPIWEQPHDDSCPWAMPVYAMNKDDRLYWLRWGWEHGFDIFPWPSLDPEIIESSFVCVDRWQHLLCFSLYKDPPGYSL